MAINCNNLTVSIFDGPGNVRKINLAEFNKNVISFGRSPENDIVLNSGFISRRHGHFELTNQGWYIVDDGSSNGLVINGTKQPYGLLSENMVVRIDDMLNPAEIGVSFLFNESNNAPIWKQYQINKNTILIGRDSSCDIVLNHLGVSRIHASIVKSGESFVLEDNNSTNGVSVNGRIVNGKRALKEKDVIVITNTVLVFTKHCITYYCAEHGGVSLDAIDLVKTVKGADGPMNITNHVSLSIKPGEFVSIIGGSGAGKTTFMNCVCGYNRATVGKVLVNGEDLYSNYEAMKSIIGYVPQQDIVFDQLKLEDMLMYAAELRMPADSSRDERAARVKEVISMVELQGREETYIRSLSGGQKKRASIAVELLSDPSLFFLDEPTSGLDPGTERNIMQTLRNLSRQGKTVVLVTHNTLNLHLCDKIVILGKGGNLCFFGAPNDVNSFFGVDNVVDIYPALNTNSLEIANEYRRSDYYIAPSETGRMISDSGTDAKKGKQSFFRQIGILFRRYGRIVLNDKQRLLILLLQPPLLAFLLWIVADGDQFEKYQVTKSLFFALSCSAFWIGISDSIQEICKERIILEREYSAGVLLFPYVISKLFVLALLCLIQALLLCGGFVLLVGTPEEGVLYAPSIEFFLTTYLTMLSAASLGLLVSSLFNNPDKAMGVAPLLLMPQIIFSGLAFELTDATKPISTVVSCRWSMEAYGTTGNLNSLPLPMQEIVPNLEHEVEEFFEYTAKHIQFDWYALLILTVAFIAFCWLCLKLVLKKK